MYAYVGNNPVNYVDPTGHLRVELYNDMELGRFAHVLIEMNMFKKAMDKGQLGIFEYGIDNPDTGTTLRADFYNLSTNEIYEIKPATYTAGTKLADAQDQLSTYLQLVPGAVPGTSLQPDQEVAFYQVSASTSVSLQTFTHADKPGLVFYKWVVNVDTPSQEDVMDALKNISTTVTTILGAAASGAASGGCGGSDVVCTE